MVDDDYRSGWAKRTIITDWFMLWLAPFIEYCKDKSEVKREYLVYLKENEHA